MFSTMYSISQLCNCLLFFWADSRKRMYGTRDIRNVTLGMAIVCSLIMIPSSAFAVSADSQQNESSLPTNSEKSSLIAQSLDDSPDGEADIASGTSGTCKWRIDSYGNLTISPAEGNTGQFTYSGWFPWDSYRGQISSVRFTGSVKLPANCANMFGNCTQLANVDLTNADASEVKSMNEMFKNCTALTEADVSMLNTPKLASISWMFWGCSKLQRIEFGEFNTSQVTTMGNLFNGCHSLQTLDISNFNTGNVKNMSSMFSHCPAAATVDFSQLNTSSVTDMSQMFAYSNIAHLDLSQINTSSVENMSFMFTNCSSLTNLNLSGFDTSHVTNMQGMFNECHALEKVIVGSNWTTSAATATDATSSMFKDCNALIGANGTTYANMKAQDNSKAQNGTYARIDTENTPGYLWPAPTETENKASGTCGTCAWVINSSGKLTIAPLEGDSGTLEKWSSTPPWTPYRTQITSVDIEKSIVAPTCSDMFSGCTALTDVDLEGLNTANADSMAGMFHSCIALTNIDVSPLSTSSATSMMGMFWSCTSLGELDLHTFNTSKVRDMSYLFCSCPSLTSLNITGLNTSSVTNMASMFSSCPAVAGVDFSKLDTSNVTNMHGMFEWNRVSTLDVSHLNTSSVTNMSMMFGNCASLSGLNLSGFSTSKVTDMQGLFARCSTLTELDLSSFDTSSTTNMQEVFYGCTSLRKIIVGDTWRIRRATNTRQMFTNCNALVGAKGTAYTTAQVEDGAYAYVDTDDEPGYLWSANSDSNNGGEGANANESGSGGEGANANDQNANQPTDGTGNAGTGNAATVKPSSQETNTSPSTKTASTANQTVSRTQATPTTKQAQRISGAKTKRFSLAKATIILSKRSYAFDGKTHTPSVTVKLGGKKLKAKRDFTVSYAKGRKAIGTYRVVVIGRGSYSAKVSTSFSIVPKAPRVKSVKAHKNSNGSSGFIATWNRVSGKNVGYTLRWSASKSFKTSESFTFKSTTEFAKKARVALRVRAKAWLGKKIYVQIRSFQAVGGKTYNSAWSASNVVKLKK